jgi:hypothetical protein
MTAAGMNRLVSTFAAGVFAADLTQRMVQDGARGGIPEPRHTEIAEEACDIAGYL